MIKKLKELDMSLEEHVMCVSITLLVLFVMSLIGYGLALLLLISPVISLSIIGLLYVIVRWLYPIIAKRVLESCV